MVSPINLTLRGGSLLGITGVSFISGIITISTNGKEIGKFISDHSDPVFQFIKKHGAEVGSGIKTISSQYYNWGEAGFGSEGVVTKVFKENFSMDKMKDGFIAMTGQFKEYYGFLSDVGGTIFSNAQSVKEGGKSAIASLILSFPDRFASLLTTCGGGSSIGQCSQENGSIWDQFEELVKSIFYPEDKKEE